jgi:hypothetical protein
MLAPLRKRAGRRLREPFGKAGLTVAVIALVFAMFGGAYAASNTGGKATASAKAKKGPRGPKGPAGPAGATGPAGPAGPQGPKGDTGPQGEKGAQGDKGEKGAKGDPGSPWTAGGVLPGKATETGTWAARAPQIVLGEGETYPIQDAYPSLSFPVPLAAALDAAHVHYINAANEEVVDSSTKHPSTVCLGSTANPTAAAGHLCVYTGVEFQATSANDVILDPTSYAPGASKAGAFMKVTVSSQIGQATGTYAVTAP